MPRSGTTLLEQIISSHSEIYGAGELNYLNDFMFNNLNSQKLDISKLNQFYLSKISLLNIKKIILLTKCQSIFVG